MIKRYLFFSVPGCGKCPAVRKFLAATGPEGEEIDASSDEGLERAMEHGVMATPTVIFFDASGKELCRASNVDGVKKCLSK